MPLSSETLQRDARIHSADYRPSVGSTRSGSVDEGSPLSCELLEDSDLRSALATAHGGSLFLAEDEQCLSVSASDATNVATVATTAAMVADFTAMIAATRPIQSAAEPT